MAAHNITHGMYGTPTHRSWRGMFRRCQRPAYQQKGIVIAKQWQGRTGFAQFLADMGERPTGMTLDRIDNRGNYEPANCRWATWVQQGRNRGNNIFVVCDGVRMTLNDACDAKGWPQLKTRNFVKYAVQYSGLSIQEAFDTFNKPKRSLVIYKGKMMPVATAARLAGARQSSIYRKAQIEGLSLQAAFDHFASR